MATDKIKQITKILKALSDESRIRIICLLKNKKDVCVCEITEIIGLAQPTISSHLRLLESAGLIESSKSGQWVNYNINDSLDPFSMEYVNLLFNSLKEDIKIKKDAVKIRNINRNIICRKRA